jgi:RNA polymerase sigma-70 factor (ECF subfamily)
MDPLITRAKKGDRAALEQLLGTVAPSIQRFGMRMCKNGHDAEDVLQDTLLTILSHLGDFEGRSSFSSWVFVLTRSACNRRRRGLKNKPGLPIDDVVEPRAGGASPEQRASDAELRGFLVGALDGLPEEHREAILLRDVEGLSAAEAADALGLTVEALKSRLHRGRQALRGALKPALEPRAPAPSAGCPDVMVLWSRKLEGDLSALDCAEMEKHLEGCPACASACDALKAVLVACQREATLELTPEVQRSVKAAVHRWLAESSP